MHGVQRRWDYRRRLGTRKCRKRRSRRRRILRDALAVAERFENTVSGHAIEPRFRGDADGAGKRERRFDSVSVGNRFRSILCAAEPISERSQRDDLGVTIRNLRAR